MADRQTALEAVRTLLRYIGDDPTREGLADTPERVLRAWEQQWGAGYQPPDHGKLLTLFTARSGSMVTVQGIAFYSHCEHHMAPFFGYATVAYLPQPMITGSRSTIIGLSKLARIVQHHASKLQTQERLTDEIADYLAQSVSEFGVAVDLRAQHMCMMSRGVQQPGTYTTTTALRGAFATDPSARAEFLALARQAPHPR